MRKLIEKIQNGLEDFIEQRDNLVMIVSCDDNDAPLVLKIVSDLEQADATDVYLLFADDFVAPDPYVSVTIERLREQHKIANEWLVEQGRKPLPPIPKKLTDETRSPAQRLGDAIMYARSLLPKEGGHRLIWVMFPQQIKDRKSYIELTSIFIPWRGLQPWMRGIRFIFRDEPETECFMPELVKAPRARIMSVDMSPDAIQASLKDEVEDEELPDEQRMTALLQNAMLEAAHGHTEEAMAQYNILLGHYQHTNNHVLQALVLNAIGDIYNRANNFEKAQHWYECAVPPAVESKSPVMLHTVVRNLADLAFRNNQHETAEQLYNYADQLAGKMLYAEGMAQARERRGLIQERLKAYKEAIDSWERAAQLCRNTEMSAPLKANLEHLARGYERLSMSDKLAAVRTELRQIESQEEAK